MPIVAEKRRLLPTWLIGLFIAIVIFGIGFLLFQALGFGDNPVLESGLTLLAT